MAIDVKFQRQAMLEKGCREEVEVSQEVLTVIDASPCGQAGTVVEQIEQWVVASVMMCKPRMRRGIQLPKRSDFEALPAASGCQGPRFERFVSQPMSQGPAADSSWVNIVIEATKDL